MEVIKYTMQILELATTHLISLLFNRCGLKICTSRFGTDQNSWNGGKVTVSTPMS